MIREVVACREPENDLPPHIRSAGRKGQHCCGVDVGIFHWACCLAFVTSLILSLATWVSLCDGKPVSL